MINLARRPAKKHRIEHLAKLLGLEIEIYPAVDGTQLKPEDLVQLGIKQLPGYLDPILKRNMKLGEIGCFLSHYNIWKQIVKYQYDRVIVLEDDVKFIRNFKEVAESILAEGDDTGTMFDLIYLGRKNMGPKEKLVKHAKRLVQMEYAYWTIAYVLTLDGAKKLLEAKPLQNMLPVDEFLPIMYNKHPNSEWMNKFSKRDVIAWGAEPPIAEPLKYIGEPGYLSDTEQSVVIQLT